MKTEMIALIEIEAEFLGWEYIVDDDRTLLRWKLKGSRPGDYFHTMLPGHYPRDLPSPVVGKKYIFKTRIE